MARKTTPKADDLEAKLLQTATECQQDYYEICSDWNRFTKDEHEYVRDFIGYALFGPPNFSESASTDDDENNQDFNHFVYKDTQKSAINRVFQKVIKYGTNKRFDNVVLCGIIYIVIFNKKEAMKALKASNRSKKRTSKDDSLWKDVENNEMEPRVYPVPLFKARGYKNEKIEKKINNGEIDATENNEYAYYIDNSGRVYDGFADYLAKNTLPSCTMVVPKNGRYQGDPYMYINANVAIRCSDDIPKTNVWIEVHKSPASKPTAKVLKAGDIATTVATVASMGVAIAAMVTPVGLGVAIAGAVGAGVGGLWSIGRSSQQLADRGQHRESINVTNKNALGAWIGIASGTMCLAASGGSALLVRAVRTGATISRAAMIAHDAVQIGNMIVNGVGFGFKSYDIYAQHNTERFGVLIFTAHAFFFCNSVINARLAQSMVESTDEQLMKDYEISLRGKRHRKEFQQMARNTSDQFGNEEIIRAINKIDTKDEIVQAMVKNQKDFSVIDSSKASFSSGDQLFVNGITMIDPIEFSGLPQEIRAELLPVTGKDELAYKYFTSKSDNALKEFCAKRSSEITQSAPVSIGDFTNVLRDLRNMEDRDGIFVKLLAAGYKILKALPQYAEVTLGDTFAFIVQFLWDYVKLNLREMRPGMMIEEPSVQALLNDLMTILFRNVEANINVWVKAFVAWVKIQFPLLINLRFFYNHKMASVPLEPCGDLDQP